MKWLPLIVLALPLSALAQERQPRTPLLNYTYAELRYLDTDGDGDGLRAGGSFAIDENWLIVGGLTSLDFGRNVDLTRIDVGAGYVHHFDQDFDIVATLQFVSTDVDTPAGGRDDNGFFLSAGARGMATDDFEVRGTVNHVNLDNNDTFLELAGDYYFSERLSVGASLEIGSDDDVFSLGVRLYFSPIR